MRVLVVASEAYPLVKTGGLADVAGALPAALRRLGVDARILLPAYPGVLGKVVEPGVAHGLGDILGVGPSRLIEGRMPDSDVPVWLLDCPTLFDRPGGPYQRPDGSEHPDNGLRFALLSRVAALLGSGEALANWSADIVHASDWQTGLVPAYLKLAGRQVPRTVFTIHNLHFAGLFGPDFLAPAGLPPHAFSIDGVEFNGLVSTLKAGLYYADRLTTVSPTYAWEVTTPEGGRGLDGLLSGRARAGEFSGILNGVDYDLWDPGKDPDIAFAYGPDTVAEGKARCKAALQREMGLDERPDAPVLGLVSRFSDQKGIDLVAGAAARFMEAGAQIAVLGSGDWALEQQFLQLSRRYAGRIAMQTAYDEPLAHRIQAGSDFFLVPSRFEPCGLTQLYALRYGALPVVRRTGGLADTVRDMSDEGTGTGFLFDSPSVEGLLSAFYRALAVYGRPDALHYARQRAMAQDFGWHRAAEAYVDLYEQTLRG